jgi:hypothetical protein
MWPSLIKKAKEGGVNTIETYVFWNAHEAQRRQVFSIFLLSLNFNFQLFGNFININNVFIFYFLV